MQKLFYRIAHESNEQGLWYDSKGKFTGLIHNKFTFCKNTALPMPFDEEIVGWLSATDCMEELFQWFTIEDIKKLQEFGYYITIYEADKFRQYRNHLVICQETSKVKERLKII
jgi:hypothetical protein